MSDVPWAKPVRAAFVLPKTRTSAGAKNLVPPLTRKRAIQAKKKCGYEENVPVCKSCIGYKKPVLYLVNSRPYQLGHFCKNHNLSVKPDACCNDWQDRNGDKLEKP